VNSSEQEYTLQNQIPLGGAVQEETRKRWLDLCAEAAICEDPERLQQLADTINAVLKEEKQQLETPQVQRFRTAS